VRAVDRRHSAAANQRDNLIAAESLADQVF
jgi:hypothetical protein